MSAPMLFLFILGVAGVCGIFYGAMKLYRSGEIDDEAAERKRLAEEAARAEELEKLFPGVTAKLNKNKIKKFSKRT